MISRDEWCAGYEKYLALPAGGEVVVAGETIVAGETVQPVQPAREPGSGLRGGARGVRAARHLPRRRRSRRDDVDGARMD